MAQNYGSLDSIETKENVQNLVTRISNNLQQIRQITKDLGDLCVIMGGPHDTEEKRNKMLKLQKKAKDLLVFTKSLFDSINHLHVTDKTSKLTVTRVKEEYDKIIVTYNDVHEKVISKMSQMAFEARQSMSIFEDDSNLLHEQITREDEEIKATEEMMDRVKQLENNLVQAEQLFHEINKIVVENREEVENIETNVINATDDIDNGNLKLQQATVYKQKALKKKICIFVTIIIILTIIGLIIGLSLRKDK